MEEERKRSKGSLFNFFDWNGKSRKKLFLKNPDLPEGSKQAEVNVKSTAKSQSLVIELDEKRANSSNKGSSDFSCSSSATSDDGYGTRAPGVVARLMGLDSLPTSSVAEPSSTPFFNSSLRASQYDRSTSNLWSAYNSFEYLNISSNQEGFSWNSSESRSLKVQPRPIERFQTEMLPPKSAKSIPITHHKLLSPIKSRGFAPRKNPAYIIEAAAKIIEASPKATLNRKVPSIGSSSVPLRIRDLKQKMEAAHTSSRLQISNESFSAKNRKGQLNETNQSRSESISSGKASIFSEKGTSDSLRNKEKSVSPAVQVKSNVQRKEGATSRSINSNTKKQKEIRCNQPLKSPPGMQKTRTTESRTNNMLRQNNQKQNCQSGKESSTLKSSVSNQPGRKAQSISGSVGQSRTAHKVALKSETMSKRMHSVVMDSEKEKLNGMSLKKRPVNGDLQISGSVSDNTSFNRDNRSIKCNIAVEGCMNKPVENRKDGMDVVSFTFTSPVKKATPNHQPLEVGKSNSSDTDSFVSNNHPYFNKSTSSFSGLNIIGGDALGVLLEEKLRELTNKVESSQCNMIRDDNSASSISSLQNWVSTFNMVNAIPAAQRSQLVIEKDKSSHLDDFNCFSGDNSTLTDDRKWQPFQGSTEEYSSSSNFSKAEKDQYRHSSPISILELSFESGSCSNTNVQADEVLNSFSTSDTIEVEGESELSDSATSISTVNIGRKSSTSTFTTTESKDSSDWELDYVRDILENAETMLKEFGSGKTSEVVTLNLFHQLENQENGMKGNEEDYSKLQRKVLFDCVSECLDQMSRQTFVGSCRSWVKLQTMFRRKEWLVEELYKERLGWKSMGDLMVDELVDKDMSTQYGKWLNFNIEIFEEGIEIEKEILTSLVDELVSDLFIL